MGESNKNKKGLEQIKVDLKILAENHRLEILQYLKKKREAPVGEIADHVKISFKVTSKHLLFLAKKEILKRRYDGPFVLYSISDNLSGFNKLIISHL